MTARDADPTPHVEAVERLRDAVRATSFPLDVPGRADAERDRVALLGQLDDYVLPRLRSIDAPLLAVVGGSTGAGKSTLVNSVVGARVSRTGVLRPTTTSPVLIHHPDDEHWFTDGRILPGLARVTGRDADEQQPGTVRLARSAALPSGLALLDAPDIDSVVEANRQLASQLLAAADLWLFVTTAARYADAVPWDLLRTAADRGTAVAIVLDRIEEQTIPEIRPHLAAMLREQGLPTAPIFTVPESPLTPDGALPEQAIGRLRSWLEALAGDARARSIVVGQTLTGALRSLEGRTSALVEAADEQDRARGALVRAVDEEYAAQLAHVDEGMQDGTLLRGEVLARWQEFVGTGEFFRQVESTVSRWRDRITSALTGAPRPAANLGEALQSGVASLVLAHAESAASGVVHDWRRLPGGETVLREHPSLASAPAHLEADVDQLVRQWQGEVLDIVRTEGRDRRTNARVAAYGVNGLGLLLMLVTFASTGGLTGAEVGIAGGTSVLAQRVLEAIFGDQAVRTMARAARTSLLTRVEELYAGQRARYTVAVDDVAGTHELGADLRAAAEGVAEARS